MTTGWGVAQARGSSAVLQQRIATTTTTARCNGTAGWHKYITDAMLCAVYKHGKGGMCNGAAGDPLVCMSKKRQWILHGLSSWTEIYRCKARSRPPVYTRVRKFVSWIKRTITEQDRGMTHVAEV
ncbi:hypothetical protein NP493_573g01001 [Ridgeia piscesae]|uniref:Peptidase S1 domain-containing protein n=1 Tax=Ridgeia piscesae TaxID=27915 RepID=A0AAD9KV65_RIDPI|nr:hypothetical protein NP493_573g01001 [Ridgeia piscesae]